MRIGFTRALAAFIILMLTASTMNAKVLTLDDCIDLALKNRASIIAAIGSERLASSGKRAALGAFLPRLSADYSYSKFKESEIKAEQPIRSISGFDSVLFEGWRPGSPLNIDTFVVEQPVFGPSSIRELNFPDIDGDSKSLSLNARMSLFNMSSWFDYSAAKASHAAARLDVIASEQDLIYAVKISYFAYLAAYDKVGVQNEAVKRSEEQLKLIQSRFDLGSAAKSDVLKQKVQYGNDKLSELRAVNLVSTTRASLAYTIGIDPRESWEFETSVSRRQFEGSVEEAILFGLDHKPSLLATAERVNAANRTLRSAKAGYLPTIGGFASYTLRDGTRGDTVAFKQTSTGRSIGFTVSMNIFDGFLREDNVTRSSVAANNRRAELSDARNRAVSDIQTAYSDIELLQQQIEVSEENVEAAEEDLRITREKYNLGAATILDLLVAQVSLKQAQTGLIGVEFDINLAIAKLENAMGKM